MTSIRSLAFAITAITCISLLVGAAPAAERPARPNFVSIICDDIGSELHGGLPPGVAVFSQLHRAAGYFSTQAWET